MVKLLVVETSGAIQRVLQHHPPSSVVAIDAVRTIDAILDKFAQVTYDVVLDQMGSRSLCERQHRSSLAYNASRLV